MKRITIILTSFIILIASASSGLNAESNAVTDWRIQALKNFEKTDKELNMVYKQAMDKIKKSDLPEEVKRKWIEQQRKAQRSWIRFRDQDSLIIEYTWFGGSGMGAAQNGWKQMLTEKRIDDLKKQYNLNETGSF